MAASYHNVASLYFDLKNFKKAKAYNDKSLRIFKKALPITHPHIKTAQELEKRINLAIQFNAYLKKTTKPKK